MGWHFGFKLHLIINDKGELLAFKLTPGNVDDRKPVPEMAPGIFGKLFCDRGYISQDLFEKLYEQQIQLITRYKKTSDPADFQSARERASANMKQKLVKLIDKILLRKRALIETVNDQLKNIFQIEGSNFAIPKASWVIFQRCHTNKLTIWLITS